MMSKLFFLMPKLSYGSGGAGAGGTVVDVQCPHSMFGKPLLP